MRIPYREHYVYMTRVKSVFFISTSFHFTQNSPGIPLSVVNRFFATQSLGSPFMVKGTL